MDKLLSWTLRGLLLATCIGCGNSFPTAEVTGKVMLGEKPLPEGTVLFSPMGAGEVGPSARGQIGSDGTFHLSTYGTNDGAVVGTHRVMVVPPTYNDEASGEANTGPKVEGFLEPRI